VTEPTFRLAMLGGLALLRDGTAVSGALGQRKRLALLGVLAATPDGVPRETITTMLWPESDTEHARNSLSQALHAARREIGEDVIGSSNGALVLNGDLVGCDVVDFRAAVAACNHALAVELYRGPFLDGVYLRETPEFERWCESARSGLTRDYIASLQQLADLAMRRGERESALDWWKKSACADPLSGRIARSYMTALVANGRREGAIRHAVVHGELVRSELGANPDPEVEAFAAQLRTAADPPPVGADASPTSFDSVDPVETVTAAAADVPPLPHGNGARTSARPMRVAALALVAFITVALAAVRMARDPASDPQRVVVAAFENRSGDASLDQLGFMAADWIAQALERTSLTAVVDPATAVLASRSARSESVPLGDAREVRRMASETRARLVVTGSYYRDGDTLVMLARVSDARDEKLLDGLQPVRVPLRTPSAVIEPVRERVLGALAMRLDKRLDKIVPPGSSRPPTFGAYQNYMQGIAAFQRDDQRAAIDFFSKSAAADSTFALALIWKVWAIDRLSSPTTDSVLRRLEMMREQLAPLDRLGLDYHQAAARRDLRGKVAAAQEAVRVAPGSHWSHYLGWALTDMGRFDEAVAAFEQIDRGKGWTRGLITFWERFAVALHLAANHTRELEIAREARRALPASDLAVYLEARALASAGRGDELNRALRDLESYEKARKTMGFRLSLLARELESSGVDTAASRHLHERAVQWFASVPPEERKRPERQLHTGIVLYRAGRYAEAKPYFERVVTDTSLNYRNPNYDPLGFLGGAYGHLGDRVHADSIIEALLADQSPGTLSPALMWSARIAAALGDNDRAIGYLRRNLVLSGRGLVKHFDHADFDALLTYPPFLTLIAEQDSLTRPRATVMVRRASPP
jgi:DNA-binding SARP family transcriptional activator/tetratricopeptide (TPR) repeat protein/TolB-like protein